MSIITVPENNKYNVIYLAGAWISMILIAYSLSTILIVAFIGGPPVTIEECYAILNDNTLLGLLRLDLLTVFVMPLYYVLFFCLYLALNNSGKPLVTISTILVFVGLTLFLSAPSVFTYLHLSDKFASAATEIQKVRMLAAGEAVMASDIWHGTGSRIGGIMLQTGATIISVIMFGSNVFNKLTAVTGIITHGLDLIHVIIGFFLPGIAVILMAVAGPLYLIWFAQIGIGLFKLAKLQNNYIPV